MTTVRVLADLPPESRPRVLLLAGAPWHERVAQVRRDKGADFTVCDLTVPVRVER
jgi:peptidylprolyl isomerase